MVCGKGKAARVVSHEFEAEGENPPMQLKDKELVARAQAGDQEASGKLVSRYQQRAYAIALNICSGDSEEARDLTQEAFFRAFCNLNKFRSDSSFYTWFYRILVNTCLDAMRRRRRWERTFSFWKPSKNEEGSSKATLEEQPDTGPQVNPLVALSMRELSEEMRRALLSLPVRQRLAFQLKVLYGMSIAEIAGVMEAAEGTVKSHLFRATHSMREALKDWAQP